MKVGDTARVSWSVCLLFMFAEEKALGNIYTQVIFCCRRGLDHAGCELSRQREGAIDRAGGSGLTVL